MSEYTKGPWKAHPYNSTMGSLISYGDIGKGETIAIVCAQKDAEEGKAYARLIAAAPDLLEALKRLEAISGEANIPLESTKAVRRMAEFLEARKMAQAAIAKAEGR